MVPSNTIQSSRLRPRRRHSVGAYLFLAASVFASYQLMRSPAAESRIIALHPAHHICAARFSPESETYEAITRAIDEASALYGVSAELISAVIATESGCRPSARSRKGAVGLMQLMPATARGLGIANPYSVRENIFGGTKYLAQLLKTWDGDRELALASYNAGPNTVKKYRNIPPYKETRHYVRKVLHLCQGLERRQLTPS